MSSWVLVLVVNKAYYPRFVSTVQAARTTGQWSDDIVVMPCPELLASSEFQNLCRNFNVQIKYCPPLNIESLNATVKALGQYQENQIPKSFQWHKLHVFGVGADGQSHWTKWDYVLYLDCGCVIPSDLNKFKALNWQKGILYANNDSQPQYLTRLSGQFNHVEPYWSELQASYGADFFQTVDYFQTTVMLFHSSLVTPTLFTELVQLMQRWPISTWNDQGICNLYFLPRQQWLPLPLKDEQGRLLYDYLVRPGHSKAEYTVLKLAW